MFEKGHITPAISSIKLPESNTAMPEEKRKRLVVLFEYYAQIGENIDKYGPEPIQMDLYPDFKV